MEFKQGYTVNYVGYGLGNRFPGKYIELHRGLREKEYKPLHDEILQHEINHSDDGIKLNDLRMDMIPFRNNNLKWKFIRKHPSTWVQFSPFYYSLHRKQFFLDPGLLIAWVVGLLIVLSFWEVLS